MSRISDSGDTGSGGSAGGSNIGEAAEQVGKTLRELGGQVRSAAREKFEQLSENVHGRYEEGRRAAHDWEQGIESYIKEKPIQAVLVAAGIGFVLALLWKK